MNTKKKSAIAYRDPETTKRALAQTAAMAVRNASKATDPDTALQWLNVAEQCTRLKGLVP